jgi:predicted AAA+ superfamily ATPase
MVERLINPLKTNSFFLFGARGTGKTTFLRNYFPHDEAILWIDLLNPEEEDRYARNPLELGGNLDVAPGKFKWVVLDEIQKVPRLLDVVHSRIESSGTKFAMTGSNARKLKREGINLLAGRAFVYNLFPLTHRELGDSFNLDSSLMYGTLPGLLKLDTGEEKASFLRAYALTYLKEEIWGEHIVRKLDPFRKFIEIAAQCNGEIINYANIARDVGADIKTVQSYFEILEDTLLGFTLEPFHQSVRKRQRQSPKFYLFDTGVRRALDRTLTIELKPGTYAYGKAFEHLVIAEAIRLNEYRQKDFRFSYLRTKDDAEIDLVVERPGTSTALVEIKSAQRVDDRDARSLERFASDIPKSEAFILSTDPKAKRIGKVKAFPWQQGLKEIGL